MISVTTQHTLGRERQKREKEKEHVVSFGRLLEWCSFFVRFVFVFTFIDRRQAMTVMIGVVCQRSNIVLGNDR